MLVLNALAIAGQSFYGVINSGRRLCSPPELIAFGLSAR